MDKRKYLEKMRVMSGTGKKQELMSHGRDVRICKNVSLYISVPEPPKHDAPQGEGE